MQSGSGVYLGDEGSAERNDVLLKRAEEVSVGSTQMLGQFQESFGERLDTYTQRMEKLSEEIVGLIVMKEREKDLMTNKLHTFREARKEMSVTMNGIRASTKSEKESVNTSLEALKQLSERMNELVVSAEMEKELLTKELKSSREAVKQLSQELNEVRASTDREKESLNTFKEALKRLSEMMNELRVSAGTEKELLMKELKASRDREKELLNSKEAFKQLSEMMNDLKVSTKAEKEFLTKELKSSGEEVKQLSQEMNEVRASTDREKESLNTSKEALKQLSEMMNELRVSAEKEKELLTKKLKSSREAVKQLSQENNELRAAAPSDEYDETDSSSPTLFKKFKGFFVSSKSSTAGRRSHQKTQLKELEVTSEASGKRLKEEQGSVKEMEKHRAVSPSNECDEPGASRPTLFRKFKGFFGSSKSTRQGRRSHKKTTKELKINTEASSGMQLLAVNEDHLEDVQEHEERTDKLEILGSKEVEMDSTASSGRCKAGLSLVKNTNSGKRYHKMTDGQEGLESDGGKRSNGMVPTNSSVDNHVSQNHFDVEATINQTTDRQQSIRNDVALQQMFAYFITQRACCGGDCCSHFFKQICGGPSRCSGPGQLPPMRYAQSLPSLQHTMDSRDLVNSEIKIEQQPKSQKQQEGSKVVFELKVQEQDRYSYQWLKDGAELEGKCDATLILDNVELREFGWYSCLVCSQENFGINCESSRAWLDVVPSQNGTKLKTFSEVDLSTCDRIASYLEKKVSYGLGGDRQAAAVFGMTGDMIGALGASKSAGQEVIEFVKVTKPDITVYTVCKQLKGDKMRRFDIAKILENHLTITESEV
ncbi:uncharacterized protein [Pocillopora verrucosa]|uniref:uncharacterized protein isoform X2 n=1 Tax=Pocillopora verrucosa TaxID=203993 RepID=UPI00333FCD2F